MDLMKAIKEAAAKMIAAGIPDETGEATNKKEMAEVILGDMIHELKTKKRNHHPFLHPTKGWRDFARPSKAKPGGARRRRKLTEEGRRLVFG
jgi:hypothetical protein